ncbi:3531_t:CDS:1, partial [Scutellospora calospora]
MVYDRRQIRGITDLSSRIHDVSHEDISRENINYNDIKHCD